MYKRQRLHAAATHPKYPHRSRPRVARTTRAATRLAPPTSTTDDGIEARNLRLVVVVAGARARVANGADDVAREATRARVKHGRHAMDAARKAGPGDAMALLRRKRCAWQCFSHALRVMMHFF